MLRITMITIGAFISAMLGYIIFIASGLCNACESIMVQFLLGFVIVAGYIMIFLTGVRRQYE